MAVVERTASINATPSELWAILANFAAISGWAPNVDHSCLMTDQAHGLGAVRRIQTGGSTVLETIESWEPENSLAYTITGLPPVIKRVTNTWRLAPTGSQTRVTLTSDIDAGPRPPQQLVAKIVGRKLGEASDQMLAGLAVAVKQAANQ
ncbi:MAG: SRPBCC family protein [Acidimicrobiales bacterium]